MRNYRKYGVFSVLALVWGMWAVACGGVEQAGAELVELDSVAAESQEGAGRRLGETVGKWDGGSGFDGEDVVSEEDVVSGEDVVSEEDGCVEVCAVLAQCHGWPAGVGEEDCRLGCGQSLYDGTLMERDVRCVGRAQSCGDLAVCVEGFWGCDEACDSFLSCEIEPEPAACRQWCGEGIMSGAVGIGRLHCLERYGRQQLCGEMVEACVLDWLL